MAMPDIKMGRGFAVSDWQTDPFENFDDFNVFNGFQAQAKSWRTSLPKIIGVDVYPPPHKMSGLCVNGPR